MRAPLATLVIVVALLACAKASAQPPNVVFILVDDLRWDELGAAGHAVVKTPNIDRLAREGALFQNAFVTTALCSPSRASFLTGQYARAHGIIDNTNRSEAGHRLSTFPMLLQRVGYETAFIGKWHMGNDDSPGPGFDTWVSFKGQGQYLDPEISEVGRTAIVRGYITDILNARAVDFLRRPRSKPFLLYLSHKAVHPNIRQLDNGSVVPIDGEMFVPAERHRQLLVGATVPRRPNFGMPPLDKPALMRKIGDLPPLGPSTVTDDATVLGRQRALAAVDDGVGDILEALEEPGQLANTMVIPAVSTPTQLVLNLDIAPTVLELAEVPQPASMDGRSLLPLFSDAAPPWRNSFVIEYFSDTVFPRVLNMGYQALRTERWKYIRYLQLQDMDELYDLAADPYELRNLIAESGHSADRERLNQELDRLLGAP